MVIQFALSSAGHAVLLHHSGTIERQVRVDGPSGSFPVEWRPVDTEGIPGRVTQIAVRHDDRLVALAGSQLFEEYADDRRQLLWRPIPS